MLIYMLNMLNYANYALCSDCVIMPKSNAGIIGLAQHETNKYAHSRVLQSHSRIDAVFGKTPKTNE